MRRGQELVEFTMLITFFLIVFFTTMQVCFTAMEKFRLNHDALVVARTWSTGPGGATPTGAYFWVKKGEEDKKDAFGVRWSRGDGIRRDTLSVSQTFAATSPSWALGLPGVTARQRLPIITPYSELVMGAGSLPNPPRTYGHRYIDGRTFIPMDKEPADLKSSSNLRYDNNGVCPQPCSIENTEKRTLTWIHMVGPRL